MNYTYLLRCRDDTLYCGWTNNLTQRLAAHNRGTGAKYTQGRHPVTLAYAERFDTQGDAMRREAAIKRLTRPQKDALIASLPAGELLTVYDADDNACGALPRDMVHGLGLRHHVCHLWILGCHAGLDGIWLQQRAASRPLFPLQYDLAATGHIAHGESPAQAVQRETQEEAGLTLADVQLRYLGTVLHAQQTPTHFDDEIAHVFVHHAPSTPAFAPGEEVARMVFLPLASYADALAQACCVPAYTQDGTPFSLPCNQLCCLHAAEWQLLISQKKNTLAAR